ncbi:hypothetical protein HMPREF0063_11946 [Aeromicrobium marinum DSM 15272]|uniref:Uncharacterized protein n=1 Tax=Aeromicrobium marinum DSM 15272 TaxID=585531 RepID=E2SE10_9ACTN|nr:hypothetical protein [Aeromicrobium marinum]EFQ82737.1 hypothetical protein HMPREF0063_11946 [Aeromicrobium marinum DSM 15272]
MFLIATPDLRRAAAMSDGTGKHREDHWCPFCDLVTRELQLDVAKITGEDPSPKHRRDTALDVHAAEAINLANGSDR